MGKNKLRRIPYEEEPVFNNGARRHAFDIGLPDADCWAARSCNTGTHRGRNSHACTYGNADAYAGRNADAHACGYPGAYEGAHTQTHEGANTHAQGG